jgi:hypothetical protein
VAGGCRKCELFTGRWLGLGEQEGSVPSRLLSRGVRQDANESRNKDLDGERVTEIQEIFSRQSNEGAVGMFLQARTRCLAKTELDGGCTGMPFGRFEEVDMDS